ncbi:hypothetical protein TNCV_3987921 [Trichonephila clavipes]|nr:hypothetical protein TNCV_3987921 [Trichonephila clavipes]
MWTRNYGALGQTDRVCFGVGQVCPDVDKELWRLGPDGSGKKDRGKGEKREQREKEKRVWERERTEGGGETEKRERRRKETERESGRERVMPALNGKKEKRAESGNWRKEKR